MSSCTWRASFTLAAIVVISGDRGAFVEAQAPLSRFALLLRAWLPQSVRQDIPTATRDFATIADLTRRGRRSEALTRVVSFQRAADSSSITAALFEVQVLAAERRLVGSGTGLRAIQEITPAVATRTGLAEQRLDLAAVGLAEDTLADLRRARQLGFMLSFCFVDVPDFLAFQHQVKRPDIQPMTPLPPNSCPADLDRLLNEAVNAGQIAREEAQLAVLTYRSRIAFGEGNVSEAVEDLREAIDTAEHAGGTAVRLRLELADAYAAPAGSPVTLGYRLSTEPNLRPPIRGQTFTRPASSGQRQLAEGQLTRIGVTGAAALGLEGAWRLRRAWLFSQGGDTRSAYAEYRDAAQAATREGDRLTASFARLGQATVSLSADDLRAAFAALEPTDRIDALSLAETALSWAADEFAETGNARTAEVFAGISREVMQRLDLQLAANTESLFLNDLWLTTGELDRAISDGQQAVSLVRAAIQRAAADGRGGDDVSLDLRRDLASLLNQLRGALSDRALIDRTPERAWTARLSEVTAELRQAETALDSGRLAVLVGRVATIQSQLRTRQESFNGRLDCARILPDVEQMKKASIGQKEALWRIQLDAMAVPCDQSRNALVVNALRALDPVEQMSAALRDARAGGGEITDAMDAAFASTTAVMIAQQFGQSDLVDRWSSGLGELDDPLLTSPPFSVTLLRGRALAAMNRRAFGEARSFLERALAQSPRLDEPRTWLLDELLSVDVASGDANRALETLLRLRDARERFLSRRMGLDRAGTGGTERAALEARLAVYNALPADAMARLVDLRRAALAPSSTDSVEADPSGSRQRLLQAIPDRTIVLAYHVSASGVTLWILQRQLVPVMRPVPIDVPSLNRTAVHLKGSLRNRWLPEELRTDLKRLYDALLPAGAIPAGWTVAVAPSGELLEVPFELLGSDERSPLALQNPVVYLARLAAGEPTPPRTGSIRSLLAVGVNDGSVTQAENEALSLTPWLGQPLLGDRATLDAILPRLRGASIAHFATHGFLVTANPYLSYLQVGQKQQLSAWQLAESLRDTDLLVLSACDTGTQAIIGNSPLEHETSDVTSFAAFAFAARVNWVVASLWKANDNETRDMMQAFYRALAARVSPPLALQQVKKPLVGVTLPSGYAHMVVTARDLSALSVNVELTP